MKFIVSIILSGLLAFAAGLYLPWWSIAPASFVVAICLVQKPVASFLSGFLGLFLLWLILTVTINSVNDSILAPKISMIMGMGESSSMLILITCILGAFVGGLGALTGSLLARIINERHSMR